MHEDEIPDFEDIKEAYGEKTLFDEAFRGYRRRTWLHNSNIANLFSIDTVIIGGEYAAFYDTFIETIRKSSTRTAFHTQDTETELPRRYNGFLHSPGNIISMC